VFFVGDNGLSERGGFALEGRTTETQVFVPLAATCERIAIELFVHQMAPSSAILETCLSVQNLARAKEFYADLFGYPVMRSDERLCAFDIGGKQVLLLFRRGSDPQGTVLPCGVIPPHGTTGVSHIGFRIPAESLAAWKARLGERGIAIESEFQWPLGGTSIYFRDPDRHLLELLTPVCGQAIDPAGERDDPANGRGVPCGTGKPARTIS
jgi:catechol 2,3-dioxygenase-like lactoylglutathione lyase family enzyme